MSAYGYEFRGQAILNAVLADLQTNKGLGSGAKLLLAGCSAGARGAMVNLDRVAAAMPNVEVRGLLDSGLWIDAAPSDPSTTKSLLEETQLVYGFANPGAVISEACAAAYAGEEYKCMFGQYRLPFVRTPYFANEAQFDSFQVTYDLGGSPPQYGYAVQWADSFQQAMLSVVQALPTADQPQSGMFSSVCLLHCVTNGPDFWTVTVNGESLQSAVAKWYFSGVAPQRVVDTSCSGWACHANCKGEEEPALMGGPGGGGGGGLRGPPGPMHPGQFQLATSGPAATEPWQEQVAQARKAAAASSGETPAQYQAQTAQETRNQEAQEKQQAQQGRSQGADETTPATVRRVWPYRSTASGSAVVQH